MWLPCTMPDCVTATTEQRLEKPELRDTLLIACGALAHELVTMIRANGWTHMKVACLPAHLHNDPDKIPESVRKRIREGRNHFEHIFVLFADCGTGGLLDKVLEEEGVERIPGNHCYEVYAGVDGFDELVMSEPASFFLTDFLVRHFDRLIIVGMGIDRHPQLLKMFFGKYKRLVYLTQSQDPTLAVKATAAAEKLGLPLETRVTGFGDYESFLRLQVKQPGGTTKRQHSNDRHDIEFSQ